MAIKNYLLFLILGLTCLIMTACPDDAIYPCSPASPMLEQPVILTIPEGILNPTDAVQFNWHFDCVPDSFEVEISDNPAFLNTKILTTQGYGLTDGPYMEQEEYWWRVRVIVEGNPHDWSPVKTFTIKPICSYNEITQIAAPLLKGSGLYFSQNVSFSLQVPESDCLPPGFHLQVSRDIDLSDLVVDAIHPIAMAGQESNTSHSPKYHLDDCQDYYWRAAFSDQGEDGPFSDTAKTRIKTQRCESIPCQAADLTAPRNLVVEDVDTFTPNLSWEIYPYCHPRNYLIRIWDNKTSPDNPLIITNTGGTSTAWPGSDPLSPHTHYYWQVASVAETTAGPWSIVDSFFTGPHCLARDEYIPPQILRPANHEIVNQSALLVALDTSQQECIFSNYQIELSNRSDFDPNSPDYFIAANHTPQIIVPMLNDCIWYYVRARGTPYASQEWGEWTEIQHFFVDYSTACITSEMYTPEIEALNDTACRYGPGDQFPLVAYLLRGESANVAGRDIEDLWWIIESPLSSGENCWIPQSATTLLGDASLLLIFPSPPLPPSAPASDGLVCRGDLNKPDCEAAGGTYNIQSLPYCKCP